jgi:hypothetical protein
MGASAGCTRLVRRVFWMSSSCDLGGGDAYIARNASSSSQLRGRLREGRWVTLGVAVSHPFGGVARRLTPGTVDALAVYSTAERRSLPAERALSRLVARFLSLAAFTAVSAGICCRRRSFGSLDVLLGRLDSDLLLRAGVLALVSINERVS